MTLWRIDSWQQTSLALAQCVAVPDADLEATLMREKVPRELWGRVRAIIGRHRPYRDVPGLTAAQQDRLAALAVHLDNKPSEEWTQDDRRLDAERVKLRERQFGKAKVKQMNLSLMRGTSASGVATLARKVTPVYLRGLWRAFDVWGARQHGLSVKRFRDYRRTDDPLFVRLRRQTVQKPMRHRSR
jgi:hypothetical protein